MGSLEEGSRQAVINCMKIQSRDKVVIVGDKSSKKVNDSLLKECLSVTKYVKQFVLEDFGERPLKNLPNEIKNAVANSTAVFYTATSKPGEKISLRHPIIKLATIKGRQAHMPNITEEIFKEGMNADYLKIKKISGKVADIVRNAKEIKVTTDKGTDFVVKLNPEWNWVICDGDIPNMPSRWSNLPDGEVFTCPFRLDGKVVVDGAVGDYFEGYNPLKEPIKLVIENAKVVDLKSDNKILENELVEYISQDENASRIGEFAIGTNTELKRFVGNMLQDEKFPGVHIAVGNSYPEETGAPFYSKAHCDFVITNTNIFVDGKLIMKEGKFLI